MKIRTPGSYLDAVDWFLESDRIEDATVENSVIFPEATITGDEVRRSIVDEDTHVKSLNLSGAVIGAHTRLNGSGQ